MTLTLDRFGRILLPKRIRDRLGLRPGSALVAEIQERGDGAPALELRPEAAESPLRYVNGLLVHTGRVSEDVDVVEFIRQQRDERARKHAGLGQ
jgi:AbrB family looped-hinge helix DNA binding protein